MAHHRQNSNAVHPTLCRLPGHSRNLSGGSLHTFGTRCGCECRLVAGQRRQSDVYPGCYNDGKNTLGRMKRSTFVLEVPVNPIAESQASVAASGAYANVFVLAENADEATNRAISELADAGWISGEEPSIRQVTAVEFEAGSKALELFEQCQLDGLVISLHTWRAEH